MIEKVHEKGQDNVVIEDLVQDVAPKAASLVSVINHNVQMICSYISLDFILQVPDTARKELEKKVKKFLKEKQNGY